MAGSTLRTYTYFIVIFTQKTPNQCQGEHLEPTHTYFKNMSIILSLTKLHPSVRVNFRHIQLIFEGTPFLCHSFTTYSTRQKIAIACVSPPLECYTHARAPPRAKKSPHSTYCVFSCKDACTVTVERSLTEKKAEESVTDWV